MEQRKISVFDFDGTLTTADTLIAFLRSVAGTRRLLLALVCYSPLLVLMKLHLYPNDRAKQRLFAHFFKGMSEADFNACCMRFAEHAAPLLRPAGIDCVRRALAEGQDVYVVSASMDSWVRPVLALHYETDATRVRITVLGTRPEVENGRLTGRFATPNCYGAEKVRRLSAHIPQREQIHITAYGDSRGDKELLNYANEAHFRPFR